MKFKSDKTGTIQYNTIQTLQLVGIRWSSWPIKPSAKCCILQSNVQWCWLQSRPTSPLQNTTEWRVI